MEEKSSPDEEVEFLSILLPLNLRRTQNTVAASQTLAILTTTKPYYDRLSQSPNRYQK
jgi:hypothetical protein